MATYQISTQTEVPQLKDSALGSTLFQTVFSTNIPQHVDLKYGANNNNALYKFSNTIEYDKNNTNLVYTTQQVNHSAKTITITNTTSQFRNGSYKYSSNSFDPAPTTESYSLVENSSRGTFAPNFPIILYY